MNTETQEARKARLMAKAQLLTMTRTQLDEYSAHVRNGSIASSLRSKR